MLNVEFTLNVLSLILLIRGFPVDRVFIEEPSIAEEAIKNFGTQKGDCL